MEPSLLFVVYLCTSAHSKTSLSSCPSLPCAGITFSFCLFFRIHFFSSNFLHSLPQVDFFLLFKASLKVNTINLDITFSVLLRVFSLPLIRPHYPHQWHWTLRIPYIRGAACSGFFVPSFFQKLHIDGANNKKNILHLSLFITSVKVNTIKFDVTLFLFLF